MSEQKEYELIVEIKYIVKANDADEVRQKWLLGDMDIGDITTEDVLDVIEI